MRRTKAKPNYYPPNDVWWIDSSWSPSDSKRKMEPYITCPRCGRQGVFPCLWNMPADKLHTVVEHLGSMNEEQNVFPERMSVDDDSVYNTVASQPGESNLPCPASRDLPSGERSPGRERELKTLGSSYHPSADPAQGLLGSAPSDTPSANAVKLVSRFDGWTRAGWTVSEERDLLESVLVYDYIPFRLLCSEPFLQDYLSGADRYCSSALVNALLCLATCVQHDDQHIHVLKHQSHLQRQDGAKSTFSFCPDGRHTSEAFFCEAWRLLLHNDLNSLPDVQAIGILSMYQIICGRESEARMLAEFFGDAITTLCLRRARGEGKQYRLVRATSYCAAISLVRLLKITSMSCETLQMDEIEDDFAVLDSPSCNLGPALAFSSEASQSEQLGAQKINSARIFQLTEWVYKYLTSLDLNKYSLGTVSGNEVMAVYRNCLDWYEGFGADAEVQDSSSPSVLFIHIYYQFCLISIFRPFIDTYFEDFEVKPQQICLEAAQSILQLEEAYSKLTGFGNLPLLVPRFLEVARSLCITIDESVSL